MSHSSSVQKTYHRSLHNNQQFLRSLDALDIGQMCNLFEMEVSDVHFEVYRSQT